MQTARKQPHGWLHTLLSQKKTGCEVHTSFTSYSKKKRYQLIPPFDRHLRPCARAFPNPLLRKKEPAMGMWKDALISYAAYSSNLEKNPRGRSRVKSAIRKNGRPPHPERPLSPLPCPGQSTSKQNKVWLGQPCFMCRARCSRPLGGHYIRCCDDSPCHLCSLHDLGELFRS